VARNAIAKHGVPGGAGWPRSNAVMPGQHGGGRGHLRRAGLELVSGGHDAIVAARAPREPDPRSPTIKGRPVYVDLRTVLICAAL
jgi:hypothetical protein